MLEGIVVKSWNVNTWDDEKNFTVGEFRAGKKFGKSTYYVDGRVDNYLFDQNENYASKNVTDMGGAFYRKDGTPLNAVAENWKAFI